MKRFLSSIAPALVALAVLAFAAPASAQGIAGHNVNVSATVNRACTVTTGAGADVNLTTTLTDLGNIPDSAAAGLSVRCTRGTAVSVQATTAGRLAACSTAGTCGTESLAFELYVSQSGWTVPVAATLLGAAAVPLGSSSNRGDLATINYIARFPATGDPLPGTYTGQVAVTYTVSP